MDSESSLIANNINQTPKHPSTIDMQVAMHTDTIDITIVTSKREKQIFLVSILASLSLNSSFGSNSFDTKVLSLACERGFHFDDYKIGHL